MVSESSMSEAPVLTLAIADRPALKQLWAWLAEIPDPEIPVVSIVDLGIVRDVAWSTVDEDHACVTVTPTYSGCPATEVIGHDIRNTLLQRGVKRVELTVQLSPAWTSDWLTDDAKRKLLEYGIVPPTELAARPAQGLPNTLAGISILGQRGGEPALPCPRCGSHRTQMISRFGSTPCKALHRCLECLEPFEHFKCH